MDVYKQIRKVLGPTELFCCALWVQLSRVILDSRTPRWEPGDLRLCRIKSQEQGEILIFKQLEWQMLRLEAHSQGPGAPAPLRLITNGARCRIVLKKKLAGERTFQENWTQSQVTDDLRHNCLMCKEITGYLKLPYQKILILSQFLLGCYSVLCGLLWLGPCFALSLSKLVVAVSPTGSNSETLIKSHHTVITNSYKLSKPTWTPKVTSNIML